jgi:putative proteasome-type protease
VTYCLAMRLADGLVFLSDTRTNAGVDNVSTYSKLFVYHPAPDRTLVVQSAGNLATTQEVLDRIDRDLDDPGPSGSLATGERLGDVALYLGRLSVQIADSHRDALAASGADPTSTFLLGGQIGEQPPDILLVYPEGNYIRASDDRPFLQIGETKYGKFLLEVATRAQLPMAAAAKVALSSMVSTARANLSVGPPYDLGLYHPDTHQLEHARIDSDSPYLARLDEVWIKHLNAALGDLPMVAPGDLKLR